MDLNQYSSIMTVEEVMEFLKIGRGKCYELLNSGALKAFRPGTRSWRIPKAALEEYINENSNRRNGK